MSHSLKPKRTQRRYPWRLSSLLLPLCFALGCSSTPRPGTGDLAFRLHWQGVSDLDLFVVDPDDACIYFAKRSVPSGGRLDIDCNRGTDFLCEKPLENIFWPKRAAPNGDFLFWVHAHALIPAESPLPFQLQLLKGKKVVWTHEGTAVHHDQTEGPFAYQFPSTSQLYPELAEIEIPNCQPTFSSIEELRERYRLNPPTRP